MRGAVRPVTHHGYMRLRGGRWRLVCSAPGWAECWERLLAIPGPEQFVEKTVLRAGVPVTRRRPR